MHVIPKYAKNEGFEFSASKKYLKNVDDVYQIINKVKK